MSNGHIKCKDGWRLCGAKNLHHLCIPDYHGCPIRSIKFVKINESVSDQIQNTLNPFQPLHDEVTWQYLKVTDDLALAVSYNNHSEPINSIAFLERRPCLNYRAIQVQSDKRNRNWRLITDPVDYVDSCDNG